jgi:hypothetical protein
MKLINCITFLFSIVLLGCKTEEPQNPPTVITKAASDVTLKNATLNGEITDEGFSAASDRGFVYSEKNTNPSVSDSKAQSGYGKGVYSIVLDKLPVNTKYYFKAYATNTKGTSYGEVQSFTTADYNLVNISTDVPKSIGYTSVNLWGVVLGNGGGNVTERGFVVGENPSPTTLDFKFSVSSGGLGEYTLFISTLKVGTKYYVRAYAINEKGISYGNTQIFTTVDYKLPSVTIIGPDSLTYNSVRITHKVIDNGGGGITDRGLIFSYSTNPTISDKKFSNGGLPDNLPPSNNEFTLRRGDLIELTNYYVRGYAINSKGVGYSNQIEFKTTYNPAVNCKPFTVNHKTINGVAPIDKNVTYNTIYSKLSGEGKCWITQNLGASNQANSMNDSSEEAAGWYFPFNSKQGWTYLGGNTSIPDIKISAIIENSDWKIANDPCRLELGTGWRMPSIKEWDNAVNSTEFSDLKLHKAGEFNITNGSLKGRGAYGGYASSNQYNSETNYIFDMTTNKKQITGKIIGYPMRCIRD